MTGWPAEDLPSQDVGISLSASVSIDPHVTFDPAVAHSRLVTSLYASADLGIPVGTTTFSLLAVAEALRAKTLATFS
jgi:hypothetical protein